MTTTYTEVGEYPIVMTVTNACGLDVVTGTLPVACEPVGVVTVSVQTEPCSVLLKARLTGTLPITYSWDLGEWGIYSTPAVAANVSVGGTYPYTLTVSNCGGAATAVHTGTFTIACPAPRWAVYLPLVLRGP